VKVGHRCGNSAADIPKMAHGWQPVEARHFVERNEREQAMPLKSGKSPKVIQQNIRTEVK
jgi:hypothetical protein